MFTGLKETLRYVATQGGELLDGVRVAYDARGGLVFQVPQRVLGSGPIALRIIIHRAGAVIQELQFTIDPPGPDFDARNWSA